ncbi:LGFP repeat-containing protein [Sanguibacter sp. HDW7]|uniref:LGFP repeat-containing protein n=1 Tax=Sanguibacter sp. HDW7 TaxID=2714931 RepID=UPI00140CFE48|nr:hypothetical protein [Sanguibacter sp. HDW7]QIK84611.1 hypothetical protein G7063_14075 [Sanguibacter sp. HDW7]
MTTMWADARRRTGTTARAGTRRTTALLCGAALVVGLGIPPAQAVPATVPAVAPVAAAPVAAANDDEGQTFDTALGLFDAGRIITDEVFFAGADLNASQVQSFLESKVATCAAADGPTCLRDFRLTTASVKANSYCRAYTGAKNERASTVIAKVAAACGVSAKSLVVLLQKEQGLVTATAPTQRQYDAATGFACPDSGGCNPDNAGFFNQIYGAGRQYQRYAKETDIYNWRPAGETHEIQYHPNTSCGTRTVTIDNVATAGLYYYTPYTPNAAAMADLSGSGDACSSFGNRNFWRLFTQWFGSTTIGVTGPVQTAWLRAGGVDGSFGKQRSNARCSAGSPRYCAQTFAGGTIASAGSTGFTMAPGVLRTRWVTDGSEKGALGWPRAAERCGAGGVCSQRFTGGYAATSPSTGTHAVLGRLSTVWVGSGGSNGSLGLPRAEQSCTSAGKACTQRFQGGYATTHPTYGTRTVTGTFSSRWVRTGGRNGSLGWPTTSRYCSKAAGGITVCAQRFASGAITSHTRYGIQHVNGRIGAEWLAKLKAGRSVGYAKAPTSCRKSKGVNTCRQEFSTATLVSRTGKATVAVTGINRTLFLKNEKKLGLPTSNLTCTGKGKKKVCTQSFAKGKIVKKGSGPTKVVLARR